MAVHPDERLRELGISLPEPPAPAAAYVPTRIHQGWVQVSGQIAAAGGELVLSGRLGAELDRESVQPAARQCAINLLAQLRAAAEGDLGRVTLLRVGVYVACDPSFNEQHLVANGVSELLGDVLGDAGSHARAAVGVAALPLGSPVEADALAVLD
ncbi:RidA family protein [Egibacter rhizosphaerae]|uniref:RidA family protein n=1 Tax=Egibacter rhizosphaerae TaxID=1670831 RepID=A0A411YEB7_9ACTN|nr:RidA family protein [Egibacter rhizosphaerae]QBI19447.1 RidA family protein [Egibacter rhizosphaerae]